MRYIRRLFISLAVSIPCLVVFTLLFKALLGFLSGICSLPLLNSLSSGDLLNGVGTFSAVIIAVVSYQHDIETKQEEERSRSEKAKPQVEVDSFEEDYGFIVSITNVGPRPIPSMSIIVEEKPVVSNLEPGDTCRFDYIGFESCESYEGEVEGSNYVVSTRTFRDGVSLWLFMYDILGKAWMSEYTLEEDGARLLDGPSWVL